ncbi:uncharacterized protein IL334_006665 [Kwoniella shivajii]|uniref:RFX-type winged-helix domain-containing protein n=1 Tax=Kwoniella shivajii TaxID=564305 RepID=A0ABZ1D6X5_9TREE|nr:hypothetical protein IL334_006665 [Kwoniella shivajii]
MLESNQLDPYQYPPLPLPSSEVDLPSADGGTSHQHADFSFNHNFLSTNSPENPFAQEAHGMTSWTHSDTFQNGLDASMAIDSKNAENNPLNEYVVNNCSSYQTYPSTMEYPQPTFPSQLLSHASSSSSLDSFSSSQYTDIDPNRLLVQTIPTGEYRLCDSSFSSSLSLPLVDNKFDIHPLETSVHPRFQQQSQQCNQHPVSRGVPTGDVLNKPERRQHQPRLTLDTQNLGTGKITRSRSGSKSIPYNRLRADSVSVKSEVDEELVSLLSASTNYGSIRPWSAVTTNVIPDDVHKTIVHRRRISSNINFGHDAVNASPPRPVPSQKRRSGSLIHSNQLSQSGLQMHHLSLVLSGTAAERQETVTQDLMDKADEFKRVDNQCRQDKARILWVRRWLLLSYTSALGRTVSRQGLYHSYILSCEDYGIKPINSASFGKAVRAAYPGILTRRLGGRGNSKYHYMDIQPAVQIEAERLNAYGDSSGAWQVVSEDGSMDFQAFGQALDENMDTGDVDDSEEDEDSFTSWRVHIFAFPAMENVWLSPNSNHS